MCVFVPGAYEDDKARDSYGKYFFIAKIHLYHREEWKEYKEYDFCICYESPTVKWQLS